MKLWLMAVAVSVVMGAAGLAMAGGEGCCGAGQGSGGDKAAASTTQPATQPAAADKICPAR